MNEAQTTNDFHFFTKLAGVSFGNCQDVIKSLKVNDVLILKPEPENKFDEYAVAVYTNNAEMCGYIKKETARKINKDVVNGKVKCTVKEITGLNREPDKDNKNMLGCNVLINITREE